MQMSPAWRNYVLRGCSLPHVRANAPGLVVVFTVLLDPCAQTHTHTHRHSLSHTCLHWLLKDVQPKSKSPEVVKLVVPQSPHMRSRISCGILAHWPNPPTAYSIGYSVRFILTFEGIGFKAQFGPRNEREPSVSFLDRVARLDA